MTAAPTSTHHASSFTGRGSCGTATVASHMMALVHGLSGGPAGCVV